MTDARSKKPKPHLLLGISGSVAVIKVPELVLQLLPIVDIKIVTTAAGKTFLDEGAAETYAHAEVWEAYTAQHVSVFSDDQEWTSWAKMGDPVLHIELRNWAHVFLLAPCSANTLAKLAYGLCDNLLTSVARAWDLSRPLLVAPAMNTAMWTNPITLEHVDKLSQRSKHLEILSPIEKVLACGDRGQGAMTSVQTIVERVMIHIIADTAA